MFKEIAHKMVPSTMIVFYNFEKSTAIYTIGIWFNEIMGGETIHRGWKVPIKVFNDVLYMIYILYYIL